MRNPALNIFLPANMSMIINSRFEENLILLSRFHFVCIVCGVSYSLPMIAAPYPLGILDFSFNFDANLNEKFSMFIP